MNFADIQKAWTSPLNRPSAAEIEAHRTTLSTALARRRRGFFAFIAPPIVALATFTAILAWRTMSGTLSLQPALEWAAPVLLILPWLAIFWFLRRHREHLLRHPDYRQSLASALRALLDENRLSQARAKTIILMHLVSIPLLALALSQLEAVGKVRPHELRSMIAFFGTVIAVALTGLLVFHFRKLRPEQARLEELLRAYDE